MSGDVKGLAGGALGADRKCMPSGACRGIRASGVHWGLVEGVGGVVPIRGCQGALGAGRGVGAHGLGASGALGSQGCRGHWGCQRVWGMLGVHLGLAGSVDTQGPAGYRGIGGS